MKLISKDAVVAEIEKRKSELQSRIAELGTFESNTLGLVQDVDLYNDILSFLDAIEVKEVSLIIHTVIAECCDWLAMNTNLSHDEIEDCRNLMLTVKDEQLKAQKGE